MIFKMKQNQGFTLIELMIVIAIVSVISALAVPSYVDHVRKGKRADAKVELLQIAQMQESYFVQNLSYAKSLKDEAGGLGLGSTVQTEQEQYLITIGATPNGCTGTTITPCTGYTLTATPQGGQVKDVECLNFTLSHTGKKDVSVTGHAKQCWK